jgi:hypothetical protein
VGTVKPASYPYRTLSGYGHPGRLRIATAIPSHWGLGVSCFPAGERYVNSGARKVSVVVGWVWPVGIDVDLNQFYCPVGCELADGNVGVDGQA